MHLNRRIMVRKHLLVGTSRKSTGHIIWDVKMDFTRKTRWVKDGHKTPDSINSSYLVALMYAALLGLPVVGADINMHTFKHQAQRNLLLYVETRQFGMKNKGKVALIKRALYGGKVVISGIISV